MKTKLLTLILFASLTFGFLGCNEEEVTPAQDDLTHEKAANNKERPLVER